MSILDIPAELLVLALRIALIVAIYSFLFVVIREIRRDWQRSTISAPSAFGLMVTASQSPHVQVGQLFELRRLSTIGRSPESTVRLDDEHISARHAEISRGGNQSWLLRDAGSTNGTQLNGQPIAGQVAVHSGDLIGVGSITLKFEPIDG